MNTGIIETFIIVSAVLAMYLIVPPIILKIKGPTGGRNKFEELGFIMIKITFFFLGINLICLIVRVLRSILA